MTTPITLANDTVRLNSFTTNDIPSIVHACCDPDTAHWTTVPQPYTAVQAEQWISSLPDLAKKGDTVWAIRCDGHLSGSITLRNEGHHTFDVGYWAHPDFRGRGLMTQALGLVADAAFTQFAARRLVWRARVGNWSSWKVAWANGFQREGQLRGYVETNNTTSTMWQAALLPDDPRTPATPWDGPSAGVTTPALDPSQPGRLVAQFHTTYAMPDRVRDHEVPTLEYERLVMRMRLIAEEFGELFGAVCGAEARNMIDQATKAALEADDHSRDIVETADALADLIYVLYGMALESGINLDDVLAEVQASNLSKLMPDGRPKLRADGKILKGPNFFPPNIARALKLSGWQPHDHTMQ